MSRSTLATATRALDGDLDSALYISRALRIMLFDLEGDDLTADARRAAAELAYTVEQRLVAARASFELIERQPRSTPATGGA